MRVSVILPVKDDPPVFEAVASVLAEGGELEFLVVDNGSAPAFRASLNALPDRRTTRSFGFMDAGRADRRSTASHTSGGSCVPIRWN